jgi:hypothetical protein
MREEQTLAEIEDFLEGFDQPTYRGMRPFGQRSLPGHPEMGGLVIAGPMRSGYSRMPVRDRRGVASPNSRATAGAFLTRLLQPDQRHSQPKEATLMVHTAASKTW